MATEGRAHPLWGACENQTYAQNRSFNISAFLLRKPALCAEPEYHNMNVFGRKTNILQRTGLSTYKHSRWENKPDEQNRSFKL